MLILKMIEVTDIKKIGGFRIAIPSFYLKSCWKIYISQIHAQTYIIHIHTHFQAQIKTHVCSSLKTHMWCAGKGSDIQENNIGIMHNKGIQNNISLIGIKCPT